MRQLFLTLLLSTSFCVALAQTQYYNGTSSVLNYTDVPPSIPGSCHCANGGDPVNTALGFWDYNHTDLKENVINDSIVFTRYYYSINNKISSSLGYGWTSNYDSKIENFGRSDSLWRVHYPDGHVEDFSVFIGHHIFFPVAYSVHDTLSYDSLGYRLKLKDQHVYCYDTLGNLDSIIDKNGNTTMFTYANGALSLVTGPGGRHFQLTYNTANKLAQITDDLGRSTKYSYDADSNLISVTDADNGITNFTYDSQHEVTGVILPNGNTFVSNTYSNGQVVSQLDGVGNATAFAYNSPVNGATTITNPDNSQMIHYYDTFYRLVKVVDELGYSTSYTYDSASNVVAFTDANGNLTTQTFDTTANLLSKTAPLGQTWRYFYSKRNDLLSVTDALNHTTVYIRNSLGNLLGVSYPNGTSVSYQVNSLGQVTVFTDANGNNYSYSYSTQGDLLSSTGPTGTRNYNYDAAGRLLTVIDENNHALTFAYNNNNKLTTLTDALAQNITYSYDLNDNLVQFINKRNIATSYTYDLNNRLSTKIAGNGGLSTYIYNSRNDLVKLTDPLGNATNYGYDVREKLISSTNKLGGITSYTYDGNGNLLSQTAPDGVKLTYTYDALNRNTTVSNSLNNTISQTFDLANRVTDIYDPLSNHRHFGYDNIGRLLRVQDESNANTSYVYDGNGNLTALTDPNGHTQTFTYSPLNKPLRLTDAGSNIETRTYDAVGNLLTDNKANGVNSSIQYDAINRPIQVNYSTGQAYIFDYDGDNNILSASCPLGTEVFTYDSIDKRTRFTDVFNNQVAFNYDLMGNRTKVTYPGNNVVSYVFNAEDEIKTVTDWNNHVFTYNYDNAGRQTGLVYPNGLESDYGYDAAGRLNFINNYNTANSNVITQSTFTLDANGNKTAENRVGIVPSRLQNAIYKQNYTNDDQLLTDSVNVYTNDHSGNRLLQKNALDTVQFTFTANNLVASIASGSVTSLFDYDAFGNRVQKTVNGNADHYVLDLSGALSQVLMEQNSNGQINASYIYGNGLLARVDSAGNELYYHFDASHNVVALSNTGGAVTDTFTYEPFGRLIKHGGNTNQPFCFLGEYGVQRENDSLYYIRARYYDATEGRFIGKDAYPYDAMNPQTLNRYVYCRNNALSLMDYNGLDASIESTISNTIGSLPPVGNISVINTLNDVKNSVNNILDGNGQPTDWINVGLAGIGVVASAPFIEAGVIGIGLALGADAEITAGVALLGELLGADLGAAAGLFGQGLSQGNLLTNGELDNFLNRLFGPNGSPNQQENMPKMCR